MFSNPLLLLKVYPKQFKLMFWGMFISTIGSSMIWPFLMIYVRHSANLPLTQAASLVTIQSSAGIIAALIAGPVTDRFGRKWVMVFSLAGNGMAYFFMGNAHTYLQFALLMALMGTFNPLYRVGADAMLADMIPTEKRPDAYAMYRLSNNAGIAIGPLIGGLLSSISYSITFFFAGAGMLVYGLLLAFMGRETLPSKTGPAISSIKVSGGYLNVFRDSHFLSFIGAFILAQMCAVTIWILMPDYANRVYSVPVNLYAIIPTTNALMVVFLQVFVTGITKRYRPLPVMMVGTFFYALGVGSVALGHTIVGFWISIVIMTVGELVLMPTASSYVAMLAPPDMRGRYMSISGLTWPVAAGTAPLLGGYLSDNVAPVATWFGGFIIGLVGIFWFFILSKRQLEIKPSIIAE